MVVQLRLREVMGIGYLSWSLGGSLNESKQFLKLLPLQSECSEHIVFLEARSTCFIYSKYLYISLDIEGIVLVDQRSSRFHFMLHRYRRPSDHYSIFVKLLPFPVRASHGVQRL